MPLLDHFSWVAPHYERLFPLRGIESLLAYLAPEPGDRLLDVGGGTGRVAERFSGRVAQVCILDPSAGMLAEGKRKQLCIAQGRSERLPFGSDVFDRVIVVDTFHHLADQSKAVQELVRVLAPGGRLVIQEPDIAHWTVKLAALAERLALMRSRFYSPEAIQGMFHRAGGRSCIERNESTAWIIVEKR